MDGGLKNDHRVNNYQKTTLIMIGLLMRENCVKRYNEQNSCFSFHFMQSKKLQKFDGALYGIFYETQSLFLAMTDFIGHTEKKRFQKFDGAFSGIF